MALSSLQTASLRLVPAVEKKLLRIRGPVGVEVTDEVGTVPGDLLHADALRSTYARARIHSFSTVSYMRPAETWGRVFAKILCGDFYQLPPAPATASLLTSCKSSMANSCASLVSRNVRLGICCNKRWQQISLHTGICHGRICMVDEI